MRRLLLLLTVGCHSTVSLNLPVPDDLSVAEIDDLSAVEVQDLSLPPNVDLTGDSSCTPTVTDCTGLCGPIFDPCLDKFVHCGACEDGGICDLFTHTCGVPKTDCAQLGAECGVVKNSCGTRLTCPSPLPYCQSGKECDSQTNTCVDCDPSITCADYGYECGTAWLGCGDITNTVECGSCDSAHVCNPFYNVCEPNCTPLPLATLCANALAARGVECGFISNGCGGRVKCPDCQPGFGCAAQGEQGKCQPLEKPVECVAANRNCGDITSVCGGKVHCGDCTPPDVCNANGICGPPCAPMTCTLPCGFISDGCGGQAQCGNCPAPASAYACINNMCCKKKTPADFAGQCGTLIDDGCGGKVNVPCASGTCTTSVPGMLGTCCVNTHTCNNVCNPNPAVTDSCTGAPLDCSCAAIKGNNNFYCSGPNGTCVPKKTCADYMASGVDGQTCSNGPSFDDGTGNLLTCGCGNRPHYCITGAAPNGTVVNGAARGICCTDMSMCPATGMCPATVPNTCVNDPAEQRGCRGNCAAGGICDTGNNVCYNCGDVGANGAAGSPCSNGGAVWTDPNGGMITLTCRCGSGLVCINGTMMVVSGANKGSCCQNTATCPAGSSTHCMVSGIPNNTCTGLPLSCGINCPAGQHCTGADGTCIADNNCSNIGVRMNIPTPPPQTQVRGGADGNPCNDNGTYYQKTGGGFFNCTCTQYPSSFCNGDNNSKEGVCACNPATCSTTTSCDQNGTDNGCGGLKSCACTAPAVCFNKSCCTPKNQCNNPPTGIPTGSCNYGDGCGGSVGKQCCPTSNSGTGQPIEPAAMTCVPHSGASPAYGDCVCVPTHKCTDPGIQDGDLDGCGNVLHCGN